MKNKNIVLTMAMGALSVISCELYGQDHSEISKHEAARLDSIETAAQLEAQEQESQDQNTMADYRSDRNETKAKAKEAQRVEKEANAAARESRYALRSEKRAQKARKDADKQAEKASRARATSDRN